MDITGHKKVCAPVPEGVRFSKIDIIDRGTGDEQVEAGE